MFSRLDNPFFSHSIYSSLPQVYYTFDRLDKSMHETDAGWGTLPPTFSAPRIRVCAEVRAQSFSRMLVVYASRAQLDRSQASASVQKGIKEELKERGGDHAFPITDVRAVVRKAKQFSRERVEPTGLWGNACLRACVCAYVPTYASPWYAMRDARRCIRRGGILGPFEHSL